MIQKDEYKRVYVDICKTLYEGVDLAAEPDKVYEQKVVSAELQMLAFSQAGGNIAADSMPTSGDGGQFGAGVPMGDEPQDEAEEPAEEDPEEDPVDPDVDAEDEEDAAQ